MEEDNVSFNETELRPNVALHPLVLIQIADHFTRAKMRGGADAVANPRVIGALAGVQNGRDVEILNSFELVYEEVEATSPGAPTNLVLNTNYFQKRFEQFKQVSPTLELFGWYSTGIEAEAKDMQLHRQMMAYCENPIYLVLNTLISTIGRELPVSIYEFQMHMVEGVPMFNFVKVGYKIETSDVERISVDHVDRASSSETSLHGHLNSVRSALTMLQSRINTLINLLELMKSKQIAIDHQILRQVSSLCQMLPSANTSKFSEEDLAANVDGLLLMFLQTVTKGTQLTAELISKSNVAFDSHHTRMRKAQFLHNCS
eukprot:CAMPEP_0177644274 /NCGR_PEP_ID=MMETSP0447-20121125/8596_1 /TAXON_ID=0 /ORGANISM="Stygamoeba regulata, Strain BSH-02190019" /LENGTH=315 /DNA_ID=CAMNT_0019146615 /DNA_START=44 /DNA_END=991 /DNA_ORIENTATION=-